jgi:Holliday junction DNA helicase RuvA
MIGRIKGTLVLKNPLEVLVDVGGVGYEIRVSMQTFYQLPAVDQSVNLYTHLVVREDAQSLYGFSQLQERALFRELIKISGIGPRIALAILSSMSVEEFINHVNERNFSALSRTPGIGKKTAERLTIEMKDRLKRFESLSIGAGQPVAHKVGENLPSVSIVEDAIQALMALGYKAQEAKRAVKKITINYIDELQTSEAIIREALKTSTQRSK